MKFRLEAKITFEADDIDDAMQELAAYFMGADVLIEGQVKVALDIPTEWGA